MGECERNRAIVKFQLWFTESHFLEKLSWQGMESNAAVQLHIKHSDKGSHFRLVAQVLPGAV